MSKRDIRDLSRNEDMRGDIDARAESLRRAQERIREIGVDNEMNPTDNLYFPIEKVPYGWEYRWVRTELMGEPDYGHERKQMKKGWSPVPADRHPEEARNHLNASHDESGGKNIIKRTGLVLCEMPIELVRKNDAKREKEHNEVLKTLSRAIQEMPADPTVPRGILENHDDFTPNLGRTFGFN